MHPHDSKWVSEQIAQLPPQMREKTRARYSAVYAQVLTENVGNIAAEGLARRHANTRLMEFVHAVARQKKPMAWS